MKEKTKFVRYVIGDRDDRTEEYREEVKALERKNTGVLYINGVSGKHPLDLSHDELLSSFRALKIKYCLREVQYQKALAKLEVHESRLISRTGFLKEFGIVNLHPRIFIRLVVLRFNELSKAELEPLIRRKPNIKNYCVKNISRRNLAEHLRKAKNPNYWIDLPVKRAPNYMHALKVMAIGVIEDCSKETLKNHTRERILTELHARIKGLLPEMLVFINEGVGNATKLANPQLSSLNRLS